MSQQRARVFERFFGFFVAGEHTRYFALARFARDFGYFRVVAGAFDDEMLVGHRGYRRLVGYQYRAAALRELAELVACEERRFAAEASLHFVEY